MKQVYSQETIASEYSDYLIDESKVNAENVNAICWPEKEQDIITVLDEAQQNRWPVTVSGARTGIVAAGVPTCGGMVLSMTSMSMPKQFGYDDRAGEWYLVVEPGMLLVGIQECLENYFYLYRDILPETSIALADQLKGEGRRLFYPPDPTELSAAIGGTVATNASGARTFKYGPTRQYIRRLRVILADGTVLDIKRGDITAGADGMIQIPREYSVTNPGRTYTIPAPTYTMPHTKHCAGYYSMPGLDLIDLFIGSEGTLGVITEIELRLLERTKELISILAFFPDEKNAFRYVDDMRTGTREKVLDVEAIEYFDNNSLQLLRDHKEQGAADIPEFPDAGAAVYTEISFSGDELDTAYEILDSYLQCTGSSVDTAWAGLEPDEIKKMKLFRHAVPETINQIIGQRKKLIPGLHKIATDLAVPDEHMHEMVEYYHTRLEETGLQCAIFGHAGNNHLHVNMMPENRDGLAAAEKLYAAFARKAVDLGGTVAAEHGIGKLKRKFLAYLYGDEALTQMKLIKTALDPENILGRDTLFPGSELQTNTGSGCHTVS
jgi:D-lactate dehydrogenase (cytochrome)